MAIKTLLLFKKETAQSFPCCASNNAVRHVHACKVSIPQSVSIIKKHEISLIVTSCVIITAIFSFASLVGGTCGPSPENPNVVHFVDLKGCGRDLKAHLKFCNILTNVESVNSERKLLLARAGK